MTNSSLSSQAYTSLKHDIMTCVLEPGQQIVQSQLVERYALGITPIREALKRLEHEGYVRTIPRFGYVITSITLEDVQDIYELRLALENSAVRLAAERASDQSIAEIAGSANFTYRYHDPKSYEAFLRTNMAFHTSIAAASGNRRLADTLSHLLDDMTRIFFIGLDLRDSAEEMRSEHLALANALTRRDPSLCESIVHEQITRSQGRVVEMLKQRMHSVSEISFPKIKREGV